MRGNLSKVECHGNICPHWRTFEFPLNISEFALKFILDDKWSVGQTQGLMADYGPPIFPFGKHLCNIQRRWLAAMAETSVDTAAERACLTQPTPKDDAQESLKTVC